MIKTADELSELQELAEVAHQDYDLAECLRLDDILEQFGMHPDDRYTCWTCKSWADHSH